MLRSILVVIAGFITMVMIRRLCFVLILAMDAPIQGELPSTFAILLIIAGSFISAIVGGIVTATSALKRPYQHVIVLIILGLFIGLATMALYSGEDPFWYQLANLVVMVVGFMIGGQWIRMRRQRK